MGKNREIKRLTVDGCHIVIHLDGGQTVAGDVKGEDEEKISIRTHDSYDVDVMGAHIAAILVMTEEQWKAYTGKQEGV